MVDTYLRPRELTAAEYELADAIDAWLEQNPYWHTPSTVARGIKTGATTNDVWQILVWLDNRTLVDGSGNGRLRRYRTRNASAILRASAAVR